MDEGMKSVVTGCNERPGNGSATVVQLSGVSYSYDGAAVLSDVELTVGAGEAVYVVGPNGGGKTTLLKLILGLIRPSTGVVQVFDSSPDKVRRRVGYVPQTVELDASFPATVLDVVLLGRLGRSFSGHYSKDDRDAAMAALEEMGAAKHSNRPFNALSGGQRQRILIARALCDQPELLLLDEATANVDPHAGARLFDFLVSLRERMAILMVSHDLGFVHNMFKRVVLVNKEVKCVKTCDLSGELIQEVYGDEHRIIHYHG